MTVASEISRILLAYDDKHTAVKTASQSHHEQTRRIQTCLLQMWRKFLF